MNALSTIWSGAREGGPKRTVAKGPNERPYVVVPFFIALSKVCGRIEAPAMERYLLGSSWVSPSNCKENTLKDYVCSAVKIIYLGKPSVDGILQAGALPSCSGEGMRRARCKRGARTKAVYGDVFFVRVFYLTGREKNTSR